MYQLSINTPDGSTTKRLESSCYRLGRDNDIDLPISESLIATIFRRSGRFNITCHSTSSITVGKQSIANAESTVLPPGQLVDFGGGVTIKLDSTAKKESLASKIPTRSSLKELFKIDDSEDQLVADKTVAMVCLGLLFVAAIKFLG